MPERTLTLNEAAEIAGVSPATLRRWLRQGLIPQMKGRKPSAVDAGGAPATPAWSPGCASAGTSSTRSPRPPRRGGWPRTSSSSCSPTPTATATIDDAAELTGLEPALIERFWVSLGLPTQGLETMTDEDLQAVQYAASMLSTGFPLVAFLQLARVYGQALRQIADAEVRLFHLYVHEPLMREGVPGIEMAEQMEHLARDLLPMASPLMDFVHQRFLQHYMEQDVVGHMEVDREEGEDLGRVRVGIAFCDLAGYTRYTEEEGEDEAVSFVERFVEQVTDTLPDDARVIKTIGDEVMIVGPDVQAHDRLGGGLPEPVHRAPGAARGHPLRRHPVPRRRLLRPRGQHRVARGGAGARGRGAGHRRRGRPRLGVRPPGVRERGPGQAQGLRRAAPAVPGGDAPGRG